jgi:hypothetical protein
VQGREPVGQGESVFQSGWTTGRLDVGGADVVEEQVVAVSGRRVGGMVAADQRCVRDIDVIAGVVVGDFRVPKCSSSSRSMLTILRNRLVGQSPDASTE